MGSYLLVQIRALHQNQLRAARNPKLMGDQMKAPPASPPCLCRELLTAGLQLHQVTQQHKKSHWFINTDSRVWNHKY